MKVELHRNGSYQLILGPIDDAEKMWLREMCERSDKGQRLLLSADEHGDYILSVEEKR